MSIDYVGEPFDWQPKFTFDNKIFFEKDFLTCPTDRSSSLIERVQEYILTQPIQEKIRTCEKTQIKFQFTPSASKGIAKPTRVWREVKDRKNKH